ncbi:MAG: hypothetical protein J6W00_14975 [Lentisphaeria bacterium]|nr:hypothetical protein [Lentisphaeria bacterium]
MKTQTCGECIYFDNGYCDFLDFEPKPEMNGCANFSPLPTNGDKIRQKSNEEFARDYVHYHSKFKVYVARLCPLNKQLWTTREEAAKANFEWLNASAESKESEGEDE